MRENETRAKISTLKVYIFDMTVVPVSAIPSLKTVVGLSAVLQLAGQPHVTCDGRDRHHRRNLLVLTSLCPTITYFTSSFLLIYCDRDELFYLCIISLINAFYLI